MGNEYQPLDKNLNPIGVLCPGGDILADETGNYNITEDCICRIFFESGDNGIVQIEVDTNGPISHISGAVGTIEYFHFIKGAVFSSVSGSFSVVKMI